MDASSNTEKYDSHHFCPSWCKCCEENLNLKPKDTTHLPTYRDVYTRTSWLKHIELICDYINDDLIDQDALTNEEFHACYQFQTGSM